MRGSTYVKRTLSFLEVTRYLWTDETRFGTPQLVQDETVIVKDRRGWKDSRERDPRVETNRNHRERQKN